MKKRRISLLLILLIIIAGCGKTEETKHTDTRKIEIWAWDETFNIKAANMAAAEYKKIHPDIEFDIQTREREEIYADVKNMLASKAYHNLPDVIMIEDYNSQEIFNLYEDELYEFSDLVDYDQFVEYKTNLVSKGGKRYGVPFDSGTAALFYRLDILEEAGFTEADMQGLTWEEFIAIGEEVYKKTQIPMLTLDPTDLPLVRIIMQSCGEWYINPDQTVSIAQNQSLNKALHIIEKMLETNVGKSVCGWNEFISAFQNGKVASVISGAWIMSSIKDAEEQSGKWRVAQIPVMENGVAASNVGGSSFYVLKNAQNAEPAAEFVAEMFADNKIFLDELMKEIGMIPCVKNPELYIEFNREDPFFGNQNVVRLLTRLANKIPVVDYGSDTYEIEKILCEEFQNILISGEWEKSLNKAEIKIEAVTRW